MTQLDRLENVETLLTLGLNWISVAAMAQKWSGLTGWKRAAVAALLACALIVQGPSGASPALQAAMAPAPVVDAAAFDSMASMCLHDDMAMPPASTPSGEHERHNDRSGHDLCCTLLCGLGCLTGPALLPGVAALPPVTRGDAALRIVSVQPLPQAPAWLPVGARAPPVTA
jgi:hypothetical protein